MELWCILQKCETRMCIHYVLNGHKQEVTKIKQEVGGKHSVSQNQTSMEKAGKKQH